MVDAKIIYSAPESSTPSPVKGKNLRKEKYQIEMLSMLIQIPSMNNNVASYPIDILKVIIDYSYEPFIAYGYIPT